MCPITIATVAAVGGLASAGVSAYGSIEQVNYSAQVARNNAQAEKQNATLAEQSGAVQAQQESLKDAAAGGELKAGQAANGVDVNSGSDLDVQTSQREAGNLDTATVASNAALQAYGYRTQATSDTAQAAQDQYAGYGQALGGLLGSASSLAFKWGGGSSGASSNSVNLAQDWPPSG